MAFSRRDFLKASGLVAGGALLPVAKANALPDRAPLAGGTIAASPSSFGKQRKSLTARVISVAGGLAAVEPQDGGASFRVVPRDFPVGWVLIPGDHVFVTDTSSNLPSAFPLAKRLTGDFILLTNERGTIGGIEVDMTEATDKVASSDRLNGLARVSSDWEAWCVERDSQKLTCLALRSLI